MKVLTARYDNLSHLILSVSSRQKANSRSKWWADLLNIETKFPSAVLTCNCVFCLGDEKLIPFWSTEWLPEGILMVLFPALYAVSTEKGGFVESMGVWNNFGCGRGSFGIVSTNLVLQQELLLLRNMLLNVVPSLGNLGSIVWLQDKQVGYTTRSGYKELFGLRQSTTILISIKDSLLEIWH